MLYETLLQGKIFLCTAYFGIVASFVFEIKFLLLKILKDNKVVKIVFEIVSSLLVGLIFWHCILKYNYGMLRLFEIVGFCVGIFVEYITIHKLLEKNLNLLYNIFAKLLNKLKKNKLFGKILK